MSMRVKKENAGLPFQEESTLLTSDLTALIGSLAG